MLLDSNAIVYFSKGDSFSSFTEKYSGEFSASKISVIEVLGFHRITETDKIVLKEIFSILDLHNVSDQVIDISVELRQKRNISLGDSIIAATALVHKLPLVTANISDFKWIEELEIIHPLLSE